MYEYEGNKPHKILICKEVLAVMNSLLSFYSSFSDDNDDENKSQSEQQMRDELDSELNANQEVSYPVPVELEQKPAFECSFEFLKAGKAKFTVSNPLGVHYTFQVSKIRDKNEFFVGVLTGPDNQTDYTYMAVLTESNQLRFTSKSGFKADEMPSKVFNWVLKVLAGKAKIPDGYAIDHSNHCGRCRRELTDPVSIRTGLGPHCRTK